MFEQESKEFGSFGGGTGGFGGRARMGRGMIEPSILLALLDKPMHGYQIITTLEERSQGMWRPSAGSIYPTLQLLEEKDYLTSQEEAGKKVYCLTNTGKKAAIEAQEHFKHHQAAWHKRMKGPHGRHDFRHEFGKSMHVIRDIMHNGSDEQKSQLKTEINHFTAALERISNESSKH